MAKSNNIITSDFYCTVCGNRGIPIPRKFGQVREPGHLKSLFCLHCQKPTNHVEIRPFGQKYTYEDFKEEFELGRFVNQKRVAIADLTSCSKLDCYYNKDGRCWNSNHSYHCGHRPEGGTE